MSDHSWSLNFPAEEVQGRDVIETLLPHRGDMALLDRISLNGEHSIVGEINLNDQSFWVPGHFPVNEATKDSDFPIGPIFPGVLMVESAAQLGICLWRQVCGLEETSKRIMLFKQIEKASFKKEARPGDRLLLKAEIVKHSIRLMRCDCIGVVLSPGSSEPEVSFECHIVGMSIAST